MKQPIPNDLKWASLKDIFSMLSSLFTTGYVDSFGVVTGECKHLPKKDITCDIENGNIINEFSGVYQNKQGEGTISTPIKHVPTGEEIVFDKYDNPHIFKFTSIYELELDEFINAIVNDYTYRRNHYIITKEAIPKPKSLMKVQESISEIVQDVEESLIYFTTVLTYPEMDIMIANVCLNLD